MTDFFHSVEFYVLATLVAALIVGFIAKPSSRGEARQHLLAGKLSNESNRTWSDIATMQPSISLRVRDDGTVQLTRHGVQGVSTSGAVSLAVTMIGFDVTIEERIVPGNNLDEPIDTATFEMKFFAPDRYHLKYNSSTTSSFVSTTLLVREGYDKHLPLSI